MGEYAICRIPGREEGTKSDLLLRAKLVFRLTVLFLYV
jgi:hypothetical protein